MGSRRCWTDFFDDIPKGAVGEVVGWNSSSADIRVKFPKGTWRFDASKLITPEAQVGSSRI